MILTHLIATVFLYQIYHLKMARLLAETCWWRNCNESTSIKLKCICCLLAHFINHLSISPVYDILNKWHTHVKSINIICFKWSQLGAHYFLVYLFQLLYVFQATMCPSSGELTVSMWHGHFSLSVGGCLVCADQTSTHTEWKIPVSHRYRNFSWWWAHSCPKHVEKLK